MKIDELLDRAVAGWLGRQSVRYREVHKAAVKQFQNLVGDSELEDLTYDQLVRFEDLMGRQLARTSIATYMRHLRVLMRWGVVAGELASLPPFPKIRTGWVEVEKGRPAREEEYRQMLGVATRRYRPLLECLWLSGLRISEAVALSWDEPPFQLDFTGRYPRFRIRADGQKARRDELAPCTPDFVAWLDGFESPRCGRVCGLNCDSRSATHAVIRIAKRADVQVTAHDFRRAFATRWSSKVKPPILMRLMRHRSLVTTMAFYVNADCDDISEQIRSL